MGFIASCVITEEKGGRSERRNKRGKGKHYRDKYRNEGWPRQKVKRRKKKRKNGGGGGGAEGEGLSQMVKKEKFEFSIVGVK